MRTVGSNPDNRTVVITAANTDPARTDVRAPYLSVVVPSYNEQHRLPQTLERLTTYLDAQLYDWEIIISDDGSRDGTRAIAHAFAARWPQVRVLSGTVNRGKGAAVRRGVLAARAPYVLYTDADLATPIEDVEKLLPRLEAGDDVAIGSRAAPDSTIITKQSALRQLMGKVFRRLVRRLALGGVQDTQCGFKLLRAPAARHIFGQSQIEGFAFDVEILLLAQALGYRLQEVGVTWQDRPGTTVSPLRDSWRMLRDIYRLRAGVQQRLDAALESLPGDDDPCVALLTLRDAAGTNDLEVAPLITGTDLAASTVVVERRKGVALLVCFGRTRREARQIGIRLAGAIAGGLAAAGTGTLVENEMQVLPLATPAAWLRQRSIPPAEAASRALLTSLHLREEVRQADIRAFEGRRAEWERRTRTVRVLILMNLVGLVWWLSWLYNYSHAANLLLYSCLVVAETFSVTQVLGYWYTAWHERKPERKRARVPGSVDVFITTYNEPVALVERTVEAAVAMPYPHSTYVLDDGNRPEMKAMVERLGASWIARAEHHGAKAGNINHALTATSGDFFAVFDADHVPHPDFLTRMMPFMEDPGMGFVQAPQYYANREATYIAGGAMDQQEIFFGPICRGKDGLDAVFCCGTNMVIRREAIDDVGGFRTNSITEDAATSVDLHERGWKSRYVPERLADGLAPEDLGAYISQQRRWARGNIEMLFTSGLLRRHMPWRLRMQYMWSAMFYLTGVTAVLYLALPCLFLLFGTEAVGANSSDFIAHFLPYIFLTILILARSAEGRLRFRAMQLSYGLFPVFLEATISAITGRKVGFHVTPKERGSGSFYHLVIPQIAIVTITLAAIVVGFTHFTGARTVTNACWALFDIVMLSAIIRAAAPSRPRSEEVIEVEIKEAVRLSA